MQSTTTHQPLKLNQSGVPSTDQNPLDLKSQDVLEPVGKSCTSNKKSGKTRPSASLPATGYVRLSTILQIFPVSRSHWYDGMAKGIYPKPIKLTERIVAWRVEDIRVLLDNVNQSEK